MPYGKRRAAPKGAKKSTRRPTKRSYKPRTSLAKKVQAIVSRHVENKTIQQFAQNVPIKNYHSVGWAADCFGIPMSPQAGCMEIFQGTGQGQRIGNSIKIKKLTFKGIIFPAPYSLVSNLSPQPTEIKFWFGYQKNVPTAKPDAYFSFFQNGSSAQNFSTNLLDMVKPVNADTFKIFKTRCFKLGFANYEHAGIDNSQQRYANNDFALNHKFSFDLTPYVVKHMKYLDNTTSVIMQRGLWLMCEAVWANGSSSSLIQNGEVQALMSYTISCDYEDA